MKQGKNIFALAKIIGNFKFIFGTRNFKVVNDKIEANEKVYKGFCIFLGIIIFAISLESFYTFNMIESKRSSIKRLLMNLTVFCLFSTYFNIMFPIFFSSTPKINTFNLLIEIDKVLRNWILPDDKCYLKITKFLFSIILILKSIGTVYELLEFRDISKILPYLIMNLIILMTELETLSFLIEANLIARRLEILNYSLVRIGTKKFGIKVDFFEAENNLFGSVWNKKYNNCSDEYYHDDAIVIFFEIYYKILNAISTLYSNYYFTVNNVHIFQRNFNEKH